MRKTRKEAAESRTRIVETAARLLRERGIDGASIADVMEAAGMTQGGFYRHFASKNEMLTCATGYAFDEIDRRFDRNEEHGSPKAALAAYVSDYLSSQHIENRGLGCPVAAFGCDAGRLTDVLGAVFAEGAERLITKTAGAMPSEAGPGAARAEAIRMLTMLVGTVIIARAIGPCDLRREILEACKGAPVISSAAEG